MYRSTRRQPVVNLPAMLTHVTMLVRDLPAVRALSLVHSMFRLDGHRNMTVRKRFRRVSRLTSSVSTLYIVSRLHDYTLDGPCMFKSDRTCVSNYNVCGRLHGSCTIWYTSGQMKARCEYVHGIHSDGFKKWYRSGQLRKQYICTDSGRSMQHYDPQGALIANCECDTCSRFGTLPATY